MAEFSFGVIGDQGSVRLRGTPFYYSTRRTGTGNTGPAVKAVADLVRSFEVSDIINIGDLTYNTGASTLYEENNGQFFNDYMAQGTGILEARSGNIDVRISRLGRNYNGLAFYEADPITGAISVENETLLPNDKDYLSSALQLAKSSGTYLSASQLPDYEDSEIYENLPLAASKNYGLLLLHHDQVNQLSSSYSQANVDGAVQMKSFYTPGRGITYRIEDLRLSNSDRDYNDLIVTLYADQPLIS